MSQDGDTAKLWQIFRNPQASNVILSKNLKLSSI